MREILFRGKTQQYTRWIYGDLNHYMCDDGVFIAENGHSMHRVIKETVGQYTGLTDKNGKKIFEGDIVKADDYIFLVKFGKCGGVANAENYGYMGFYFEALSESTKSSARYGLRDDICYFSDIEIIGNIHDNPELLKEMG